MSDNHLTVAPAPMNAGNRQAPDAGTVAGKSDIELISEGRGGNHAAIAELLERHYVSSVCAARVILRSDEESQDAVQMAYLNAFRRLDTFRGESSFKTWITRVVVNTCLMQLRVSRRRANWVQLENLEIGSGQDWLASRWPTPEESAWHSEIAAACRGAVAKLPRDMREAFNLYTGSGLTVKEVAAALGLTVAAAKARIFRARARLQLYLRPVQFARRNSNAEA
jgi:RNA polymerase sigma-70 factor (ECF subfamily)